MNSNAYERRRSTPTVADTFRSTPPKEEQKKINSSVWIPVDVHEALRTLAFFEKKTLSALTEEGLRLVLEKYNRPI